MAEGMRRFCRCYYKQPPDWIPSDFPTPEKVRILFDHVKQGGPFERHIDCDGARYVLFLELNEDVPNCLENEFLNKVYGSLRASDGKSVFRIVQEYMHTFWNYIHDDYKRNLTNGTLMKRLDPLDYVNRESHKLQLKTIDGAICSVEHTKGMNIDCDPIENPFHELKVFSRSQVEILEEINRRIYKVKIGDDLCCLKLGNMSGKALLHEIKNLRAVSGHPNVIPLKGLLEVGDGKIMGFLMPFISGSLLLHVRSIAESRRELWKTKISDAVKHMHEKGIVWGDASVNNIIINSANNEPVLLDFEDAYCSLVDPDLRCTKDGDLQLLEFIFASIDRKSSTKDIS